MLQSQVQSLSSLPQTDFLTEIFSSPERACPKSYPEENSLLRFSSGQQFLRGPLFCSNFFHQQKGLGLQTNQMDSGSPTQERNLWDRYAEPQGQQEGLRVKFRKTSTGRRDTVKVLLQKTCQQTWVTSLALDMHPAGTAKASGASWSVYLLQRLGRPPTSQMLRTHPSC